MDERINDIEDYLLGKYGILSVVQERRADLLEELRRRSLEMKGGGTDWREVLDDLVLNSDIRQYFLGGSLRSTEGSRLELRRSLLVMVLKVRDSLKPRKASCVDYLEEEDMRDVDLEDEMEEKGGGSRSSRRRRMFYLTLTTGRSGDEKNKMDVVVNALEFERFKNIGLNEKEVLPGTKFLLQPGRSGYLSFQNSILLLRDENIKYLGGCVESLLESWRLNNIFSDYCEKGFTAGRNLSSKPPKFIPFLGNKSESKLLSERVSDALEVYVKKKDAEHEANIKNISLSLITNKEGGSEKGDLNNFKTRNNQERIIKDKENEAHLKFLNEISEFKKLGIINLEMFNKEKILKDPVKDSKKKKGSSQNKPFDLDLDPGAPVFGNRFKEKIDPIAREFLKSRHDDTKKVTLFDHLFAKLDLDERDIITRGGGGGLSGGGGEREKETRGRGGKGKVTRGAGGKGKVTRGGGERGKVTRGGEGLTVEGGGKGRVTRGGGGGKGKVARGVGEGVSGGGERGKVTRGGEGLTVEGGGKGRVTRGGGGGGKGKVTRGGEGVTGKGGEEVARGQRREGVSGKGGGTVNRGGERKGNKTKNIS